MNKIQFIEKYIDEYALILFEDFISEIDRKAKTIIFQSCNVISFDDFELEDIGVYQIEELNMPYSLEDFIKTYKKCKKSLEHLSSLPKKMLLFKDREEWITNYESLEEFEDIVHFVDNFYNLELYELTKIKTKEQTNG